METAITLGVKKNLRKIYSKIQIIDRVKDIFDEIGYDYLLYSLEDYQVGGIHVHIYYIGNPIYWKSFNKKWGIGYVKNRLIYDRVGWSSYVKKKGDYCEYGLPHTCISSITKFTGIELHEEVELYENVYGDNGDSNDNEDESNLPF